MFSRSQKSFSKSHKASKSTASFSKEAGISKVRRHESSRRRPPTAASVASVSAYAEDASCAAPGLTPAIVTLVVGSDQRIFAAHEDILAASPFFQQALQNQLAFYSPSAPLGPVSPASASSSPGGVGHAASKRLFLPDDEPEIFSCVLEYLYKGDYYPRLLHNKRRNSWELELPPAAAADGYHHGAAAKTGVLPPECTLYQHPIDGDLLKDTVIYCTADKYGLDELKKIALRKQGLQSGIPCGTIISSARYAYAHTPDTDSKLRAHYLALIIRSRGTFKRSGTMQLEMFNGGSQLFFDLFVALCNHVDDVASSAQASPRSNRFI